MKKFCIIVNPTSGKKRGIKHLNKVLYRLESENIVSDTIQTEFNGHAIKIVQNLDLSIYGGIICIGGDGSFHEVVNGMMRHPKSQQIPIGVIPGGTGDSFMHDIGILDVDKAIEIIINSQVRSIDVVEIRNSQENTYSINIIGWGLVADIANLAEKYRWMGSSRYTILSLWKIFSIKSRSVELIINEKWVKGDYSFILLCNTRYTGKGMLMAPKAKLDDGLIDIIAVKYGSNPFKLLSLFTKIFNGSHINDPIVEYHQAKKATIKTQKNESLNIDGEIKGETPISVNVLYKNLQIYGE